MEQPSTSPATIKRSVWLAVSVGWLAQLGLKTILPLVVLVGIRLLSLKTDNEALWLEEPGNSNHPVWYALQASIFLGSAIAGWLASRLAPHKSRMVPIALIILSLLATGFEQFPRPLSAMVVFIWAAGPCLGLLLGWILQKLRSSDART
jgi:hypothetical protein